MAVDLRWGVAGQNQLQRELGESGELAMACFVRDGRIRSGF